jgi:DNA-binding transcriptional LysR family regulator
MMKIVNANGLRRLELRHLVAMEAVARLRSFSAAAQELGFTQSAVSQQIANLERIAGTRLFHRFGGPRPVEPTEAGRALLVHAIALLARMDAAGVDLDALAQGSVGDLRVGTFQSAATKLLPPLLRAFRGAWPRIRVTLFESGSHDDIDAGVERGALDLAFTHPPNPAGPPLEYVDLLADPYFLVVACDHELAHRERLADLEALKEVDLVAYRVCRANAEVERFLASRGVQPKVVFRAEDNHLLQGLAAEGIGAAIMPYLAIDHSRRDVALVDLSVLIPSRRIGLVWHADRYRTPATEAFIELAGQIGRDLAERIRAEHATPP